MQDACSKRLGRVVLTNHNRLLKDDGASVVLGVDEVDGDAGEVRMIFDE